MKIPIKLRLKYYWFRLFFSPSRIVLNNKDIELFYLISFNVVSTCFDKNGNQWENVANEPHIYKFSGETFTLFRFIPVHSIGKFFVASKRMFENAFLRLTGAILAIRVIKNSTVNFYSSCTGGSALFLPGILFLHFYFFTHPFSFFLFSPPLFFFFQKLAFEFFFGEQQLSIVILFPWNYTVIWRKISFLPDGNFFDDLT